MSCCSWLKSAMTGCSLFFLFSSTAPLGPVPDVLSLVDSVGWSNMAGAGIAWVRGWSGSSSLSETTGNCPGLSVVEGKHINGYFDRVR
jgi:hypothetical protein